MAANTALPRNRMRHIFVIVSLLLMFVLPALARAGTDYQISLFSTVQQQYVCCEDNGHVNVNRGNISGWETIKLTDMDGEKLRSGNYVTLRSWQGLYLSDRYDEGMIIRTQGNNGLWERFQIFKLSSGDPSNQDDNIRSGDEVALQACYHQWLCADYSRQNNEVVGDRPNTGAWERFRISIAPPGFHMIQSGTGVQVFEKDYPGGYPDYVTVVDMSQAVIRSLTGSYDSTRIPYATVARNHISDYWNQAASSQKSWSQAMVVINGTFFDGSLTGNNPASITYGLKVNGITISRGQGVVFPAPRLRILQMYDVGANIQPYFNAGGGEFSLWDAPNVIGGIAPDSTNKDDEYTGRTIIGTGDNKGYGFNETMFFFTSIHSKKWDAINELLDFGSHAIMQLDGGGSTGLVIWGQAYITPSNGWLLGERQVPHAIAIYAGR